MIKTEKILHTGIDVLTLSSCLLLFTCCSTWKSVAGISHLQAEQYFELLFSLLSPINLNLGMGCAIAAVLVDGFDVDCVLLLPCSCTK